MHYSEILKYIQHYTSTGIIHDALIPYYDQDGKWQGDKIKWQQLHLVLDDVRMRESFLCSSRRTSTSRCGTALRTTFFWKGNESLMIKYSSIEGSIIVDGHAIISAANLRHIGGNFVSKTSERIYVPNLMTVGGHIHLMHSFLLKAPRLRHVGGNVMLAGYVPPSLETVGGRLGVSWSLSLHAPKLKHVGGYFIPHKCTELIVPSLETVGYGLLVTHAATRIDAPKLHSVGGDFLAGMVSEIRAQLLRSVRGDLDTRSATDFYHSDIRVGGEWTYSPMAAENWLRRQRARIAMRGDGPLYL